MKPKKKDILMKQEHRRQVQSGEILEITIFIIERWGTRAFYTNFNETQKINFWDFPWGFVKILQFPFNSQISGLHE